MTEEFSLDLEYKPSMKPSLYDIHRSFDILSTKLFDGIVGEYKNRMCIFTNWVLGKKNVLITGQRSSGKSNALDLASLYASNPLNISLASDIADYRDQTRINASSHLIIPEINKTSSMFTEVLKDLGEGKDSVYKTLDAQKNPISFTIKAKPFITSVADENESIIAIELLSRMTVLRTDSSVDLNIKVIESKLEKAQNPYRKTKVNLDAVTAFQKYVKGLPDINSYTFIYPMGASMKTAIPPLFTDSRRDVGRYLQNTYAITLFHNYDRLSFKKGKKNNLIVAPVDIWYNHIIYGDILLESALKCSKIEKIILDILTQVASREGGNPFVKIKDIHKSLIHNGYTPTVTTVEKYCDNLYKNGYLVKSSDGRHITYEVSAFFKNRKHIVKIDWEMVIEESIKSLRENFPEYADEYKERFCKSPIMAIHPFTGDEIDVTKYDFTKDVNLKIIHNTKALLQDFGLPEEQRKIKTLEDLKPVVEEDILEEEVVETGEDVYKQKEEELLNKIDIYFEKNKDSNGYVNSMRFEETFGIDVTKDLKKKSEIIELEGRRYSREK